MISRLSLNRGLFEVISSVYPTATEYPRSSVFKGENRICDRRYSIGLFESKEGSEYRMRIQICKTL